MFIIESKKNIKLVKSISYIYNPKTDKISSIDEDVPGLRLISKDLQNFEVDGKIYSKEYYKNGVKIIKLPTHLSNLPDNIEIIDKIKTSHKSISFNLDGAIFNVLEGEKVLIGRSDKCDIVIKNHDISSEHAIISYDNSIVTIEDLRSTNGVFINNKQISSKAFLDKSDVILLGNSVNIQLMSGDVIEDSKKIIESEGVEYPVIVGISELVKPQRLILKPNQKYFAGRDPNSDLWIGAPHVSRQHCSFELIDSHTVKFEDLSTNGTNYSNRRLKTGDIIEINSIPSVFSFSGDISIAVCFNEEQVQKYIGSSGSLYVFLSEIDKKEALRRKTETYNRISTSKDTELQEQKNVYSSLGFMPKLLMLFGILTLIFVIVTVAALIWSALI